MAQKQPTAEYYQKLGHLSVGLQEHRPATTDKWHKTPLGILVGLVAVLLLFTSALIWKHGSLATIRLAGQPIRATASLASLQNTAAQAAKSYKLKIKYTDGSQKSFDLKQTGVSVDPKGTAVYAKKVIDGSFYRRLAWWRPLNIDLKTKVDQKTLDGFVASNAVVIKVAPVDATLSVAGGKAVITPDKAGGGSQVASADKQIISEIAKLGSSSLLMQNTSLPVAIKAGDLESSRAKAQALLDKSVVLTIAGNTVTASPSDIAGWLDLSPVAKDKTVDVTVDSGKVLQYINSVARRYISVPRSRLIVSTASGDLVLDPGADGVDIVNKDKTAAAIAQNLTQNAQVNLDLAVQYTPASTVQTQAYDKWFVADVTNKRMYAYEGTNLIRSFLISAGAPATPTVLGDYTIYRKYASQDMTGNNADGSRYFQPAVPYVNYFYGGYAIHGNYWRPASYFGNINSSHGCLGVSVADAAWIYDWADIGTHVVIHK